MAYLLHKLSSPGWTKCYENEELLIDGLRNHICQLCLNGDEDGSVVDVHYNGKIFICRDIGTLLSTPCGCEFDVEDLTVIN